MNNSSKIEEVGFVQSVKGKIASVSGLPSAKVGELVVGENGAQGYIAGLFVDYIEVYLLSDDNVEPGQMFRRSGDFLGVIPSDGLLGRVISPLGIPLDEKGAIGQKMEATDKVSLDQPAVGIVGRRYIEEQFETGIIVIDTLFPLGKGQRELVIGESRAGKTAFLLDVIANQKDQGVICVLCLIGKPIAEARDVWRQLENRGILTHTVVVMSTSTDPAPMVFLTPQTALTVADFFRRKRKDVLVILDDMGVHARNYRELSLVSGRPPGRESYPGDIFYQQARLLERAGSFDEKAGGGSITALPVIELALSDLQAFIPTNLMGMTDGHLLFRSALAQKGQQPALDLSLSVTRVGSQTQKRLQNSLATRVKETLARGGQLEIVSRFGSELPLETKRILSQKGLIEELLIQKSGQSFTKEMQVILLSLPFSKFLADKDRTFVKANLDKIVTAFGTDPALKKIRDESFSNDNLDSLIVDLDGVKDKLETMIPSNVTQIKKAAVPIEAPQPVK
ncbi:MAG: hypothetical protein M1484_04330 [Patescibacteria group bacterium]|nr:hypothetical protein [Patescibacteria group bacterium]MCL5432287.1 hypothetical protein [Patescibacteria group bacterium]